jgi:myo-inositol-1(or 4)-monophosphatase
VSISLEYQIKTINDVIHDSVRFMQRDFGEIVQLQNSKKGVKDFVNKCYSRLGNRLTAALAEKRPNYGIISANQKAPQDCEYFFVVEPISGVDNFQRSIPFCCSVIALFNSDQEALAIAIHNPILRETFYAAKSFGAWFENYAETIIPKSRMRVSTQSSLSESFIATSYLASPQYRNLGCNILEMAYLSAGRLDIVMNQSDGLISKAGFMLIREAGGYIEMNESNFFASNQTLQKHANTFMNQIVK